MGRRRHLAWLAGLLLACGSAPAPPEAAAVPEIESSPLALKQALVEAGIDRSLTPLIPARAEVTPAGLDADRRALRVGVVLADLLLTAERSTDAQLASQLEALHTDLERLGLDGLRQGVADVRLRVRVGGITRPELRHELERLSLGGPEAREHPALPLIRAGAWLEGASLVAVALRTTEARAPEAADVLKVPKVIAGFRDYLAAEASDKVPSPVAAQLEEALAQLHRVASKPAPLTDDDLLTVQIVVGDLLSTL